MLTLRPAHQRGLSTAHWLHSRHTFSFGEFFDPAFNEFRGLRVLNDDIVAPGQGFGTHGHRDMEILTLVLSGELAHKDSLGHGATLRPGEAQVMTAGRGIRHSEFNASPTLPVHFLQMWLIPRKPGLEPAYGQRAFHRGSEPADIARIASGSAQPGALAIHADAEVYRIDLRPHAQARLPVAPGRAAWVHIATGSATSAGTALAAGDGFALTDEPEIVLASGTGGAMAVVFDLA